MCISVCRQQHKLYMHYWLDSVCIVEKRKHLCPFGNGAEVWTVVAMMVTLTSKDLKKIRRSF